MSGHAQLLNQKYELRYGYQQQISTSTVRPGVTTLALLTQVVADCEDFGIVEENSSTYLLPAGWRGRRAHRDRLVMARLGGSPVVGRTETCSTCVKPVLCPSFASRVTEGPRYWTKSSCAPQARIPVIAASQACGEAICSQAITLVGQENYPDKAISVGCYAFRHSLFRR
jgi:hypothetical protein